MKTALVILAASICMVYAAVAVISPVFGAIPAALGGVVP